MDKSTLMDLIITTGENVSYNQNNVSNYNLLLQPNHLNLNLSIYSFVHFVDQLPLMSFIPSGASTRTQTTLKL